MSKEAKARILINDLLRRSRWRFFDDATGPANVALEAHVKLKKKTLEDLGDDFEKTANGFTETCWEQAKSLVTGGGQPQFNGSALKRVSVPLPPLDLQREIVAEIEAERALVEANRKLMERFEKKIQSKLSEIWGEEISVGAQET